MALPNSNYTNLSSITNELFLPKMVDQIFNSNALFARWKKKIVKKDGGLKIVQPLLYATTTATGWYSGADTLDITPNEKRTAAEFEWKYAHASLTITRQDELVNSGTSQIIDHVRTEVQVAEKTLSNSLGTALFNAGTTTNALIGLRLMCQGTGYTYGNISKTTYSWWRSSVFTDTVLTLPILNGAFGDLTIDSDGPSVIVTTQDILDDYCNLLQPQQRFADSKTADAGFQNLTYRGKPIVVDSHCPTGYAFMLNESYIDFIVHKDEMFRFEPFIKPPNQNVSVAHIYFAGVLVCNNCRMQGMFTSIA